MAQKRPGVISPAHELRMHDIADEKGRTFSVWSGLARYELYDLAVDINETTGVGFVYQCTALPADQDFCVGCRPSLYSAYWTPWNRQGAIADLAGGADLADVIAKVNTLLARLRAAKVLAT